LSEKPLVCPGCARTYPRAERFCAACGMPLVYLPGPERAASERQRKARKIKPQYAEGELVKIARAENQTEAEFIEGLLLEEGIPSMLRRSRGFDVPDFLAAGPRDVLVPQSGAQAAREALAWDKP
jgi:Putative prokaryotic signal transducing protein